MYLIVLALKIVVGCKWIYTTKQNLEGKIERCARLVVSGYSQTYGIDYDEICTRAKMNAAMIFITCATNFACGINWMSRMHSCTWIYKRSCTWRFGLVSPLLEHQEKYAG
jgi:hypothetical protein